jgi:adenylate cyclase
MIEYTSREFGDAVMRDFRRRQSGEYRSVTASIGAELETKALGHPAFEDLVVGERRAASVAAVFLDLTDFTGRSFWDEEDEVVDLAHAVLSGFVSVVSAFGGYPLCLRGDGLFAGFGPGDARVDSVCALSACAFALHAVGNGLNPQLDRAGIHRVQARAGVDHGRITFVRTGSRQHNEVNAIGFAANFAAKCEKKAKSWEIVIGQQIAEQLPDAAAFIEHEDSPKPYQRNYERRYYKFYDYRWRTTLPYIPGTIEQINGNPTATIAIN